MENLPEMVKQLRDWEAKSKKLLANLESRVRWLR